MGFKSTSQIVIKDSVVVLTEKQARRVVSTIIEKLTDEKDATQDIDVN